MYQDYKDLLSAFHSHGVKYLVVGGFAVIYHSQPRFTKARHSMSPRKISLTATVSFALAGSRTASNILPAIPRVDFAWEKRVEVIIDAETGQKANFISAQDLIASKLASGRLQDLADADAIRKATGQPGDRGK